MSADLIVMPKEMVGIIEEYVKHRRRPEYFIYAVLCNDLSRTLHYCDPVQLQCLPQIMEYICEHVPHTIWGSYEAIERHIQRPLMDRVHKAEIELQETISGILFDFTNKYAAPESELYPHVLPMMLDVLKESTKAVQRQQGTRTGIQDD